MNNKLEQALNLPFRHRHNQTSIPDLQPLRPYCQPYLPLPLYLRIVDEGRETHKDDGGWELEVQLPRREYERLRKHHDWVANQWPTTEPEY